MGMTSKLLVVMIVLFAVGVAMMEDPAPAVETPEQIAAKAAKKEKEALQYLATSSAAKAIKASMRDPQSIVFASLRVSDDAKTVCAEYSGRNGFGGMSQETAVVTGGKATGSSKAWNKRCTGPMRNMMYVARQL